MVDKTGIFHGHMGLPDNMRVRDRLMAMGSADDHTKFICTHFFHGFDPDHDRIAPLFERQGFITAYDGYELEF